MSNIEIEYKLRPCYVYNPKGQNYKALFHCWSMGKGIVEYEGGLVRTVEPYDIRFADNPFVNYMWDGNY
jgi:hypothetical protein